MKNILQECIDNIKDLVGNEYLYFDSPLEVKVTPHSHPFYAWGVCVSPTDHLYVMDDNQEWHQLELNQNNATLVVGSLYQRLKLMHTSYAKAS